MMEVTGENRKILEVLEKRVLRYIEEIKWYGKLYLWLQLVLTVVFVAGWFWALHSFKKEFDCRLEVAYMMASKLVKAQEEHGKILDGIRKVEKVGEAMPNRDDI
jgi:hypothetical protein